MNQRTLVLPEAALDERVRTAVATITDEGIAAVLDINALTDDQRELCASTLRSIPRFADADDATIEKTLNDPLMRGALCVRSGLADGMIAGAAHATADVLRAALRIIGVKQGCTTASSCFVMKTPNHGDLIFADCAVNPHPTSEALVQIAQDSAAMAQSLGIEPRIALLSASTHGSAVYDDAQKVQQATQLLKQASPELAVEGEVQLDVAIEPSVARLKKVSAFESAPANVLIFPDLDSGNIGYKLVERIAGAQAIGPILQGFNAPVNDLSRGCSVEDIIELAKITVKQ